MSAALEISIGQRYGDLTIVRHALPRIQPSGQKPRRVICLCDCGKEKEVLLSHLIRGKIKTCGCYRLYHGETYTPIHRLWRGMRNRCKPTYFQREYYYDKGISVCIMWRVSYIAFRDWALSNGYKPGLQLDRRLNWHGYSPGNCRFVTQEVNLANRDNTFMVTYKGETVALTELCGRLGFNKRRWENTYRRIKLGWSIERAIETPTRTGLYTSLQGKKSDK